VCIVEEINSYSLEMFNYFVSLYYVFFLEILFHFIIDWNISRMKRMYYILYLFTDFEPFNLEAWWGQRVVQSVITTRNANS